MKKYYIDLRSCEQSEHDRIMKLLDSLAWDIYTIASVPKVYQFMWDSRTSIREIPGIPYQLISSYPPNDIQI